MSYLFPQRLSGVGTSSRVFAGTNLIGLAQAGSLALWSYYYGGGCGLGGDEAHRVCKSEVVRTAFLKKKELRFCGL